VFKSLYRITVLETSLQSGVAVRATHFASADGDRAVALASECGEQRLVIGGRYAVPRLPHPNSKETGEFDGIDLQAELRKTDWRYVCRTASNSLITACGVQFQVSDLEPARGQLLAVTPAWMTAKEYGPVSILAIWEMQYQHPIYLVSNISDLDQAVQMYKKRPHIETFFSDQKSRGLHIQKSHLSDPKRVCRLLIASCLAYLWIVYLGVCAIRDDRMRVLHRQNRCDLSLFRLGLRLLARALKDHIRIPDGFLVPLALPAPFIRTFQKQAP
jgi:hypothetical protein